MLGNEGLQLIEPHALKFQLAGAIGLLGFACMALQPVVMADAAAGDFNVMLGACLARADDGAVMAHLVEVSAVAAAWALARGLVADLGVFGYEPHVRLSE